MTKKLKFPERLKARKEKEQALISANKCLDGAIKQLKKGKSYSSYLFQFCLQFKRYCKLEQKLQQTHNEGK